MNLLILSFGIPFVTCLAVFVYASRFAPEGFEDETGFFLGQKSQRVVSANRSQVKRYQDFLR